jgi:hypothetical protein
MIIPPIVNRYNYPSMNRIDGEIRLYQTPSGNLPSVTTILSATDSELDKNALLNWRLAVGEDKATEIVQEACNIGTLMHENLERRLDGNPDHVGSMPMRVLARRMADVIQENAWCNVTEVWGQEVPLYYPGMWAGTTDLVGTYKGEPAIMDYKNSRRIKTRDDIENYFMQGCAYALAHNLAYGTNIRKVVIFMCVRKDPKNLKYLEFEINNSEFDDYAIKWVTRVNEYYNKRIIQ